MNKLLSIIFLVILSLVSSAKTEVEIKSNIEVGTALNLQLEDLVSLNNQSAYTIRSVIDMNLPFTQNIIEKDAVLAWLKTAVVQRPDLKGIIFKIPQAIEIKRLNGLVKTQIKQRIENRLGLKCADCVFQVQISNVPVVNAQSVNLDWKDVPLSGAFMLPVTSSEGQNLSWISGQIKAQRQVVKTARVLRVGDTVQDSDLMMEISDITFSKDYYVKKSDLIGKKASRLLTLGTLLTSNDIQREYDVKQGQTVKTIAGNETFEITLHTVAQDSGVAGDTIRVRNSVNQKILSARIVEKGMVRIE